VPFGAVAAGYRRWLIFTWAPRDLPRSCPPDGVCFPLEGQKKRANRKERAVLLIIAVLLLALILFGVGFAVHVLWWIALIVLALWLLGFLFRTAEGAGPRRRWYRW
jgi:fatty acid desaturase